MRALRSFWVVLALLSLAGGGLALAATWRYGAGVSADAVKNMSTAESLLAGRGFFDHAGIPLVYWPPLYPLLLAGISLPGGWDVFAVGWVLNLLLMVVNAFLGGALVYAAFRERPLYAYLGSLFVAGSESALRIHANVASDPLYITFSLAFLLAAIRYLQDKSWQALAVMWLCAALAMLQRWLGAGLLAMGGVVILAARWKDWRCLLRDWLWMGTSLLPIAGWVYFHNIAKYQTFWGNDSPPLDVWVNFEYSLTKMLHWFLPYHPRLEWALFHPLAVIGLGALLLLLAARRQEWIAWRRDLWRPEVWPTVFFLPLSLLGMAFNVITADHRDPYSDRYYVGLLAPVIVLAFLTLDDLLLPRLRLDVNKGRLLAAVLFGAWFLAYPAFSLYKYLSTSLVEGEASNYNYYNNRYFRENPAVAEIQALARAHPEASFYSNYADGMWFYTRRTAPLMPRSAGLTPEQFREQFAGWPGGQPGYILWFLPNEFKHVAPPDLLAEIADLRLVYASERGEIYSVRARP
ncbi:MAG: ArnT family glycosyltransferase [Chloroflexota bacterium]